MTTELKPELDRGKSMSEAEAAGAINPVKQFIDAMYVGLKIDGKRAVELMDGLDALYVSHERLADALRAARLAPPASDGKIRQLVRDLRNAAYREGSVQGNDTQLVVEASQAEDAVLHALSAAPGTTTEGTADFEARFCEEYGRLRYERSRCTGMPSCSSCLPWADLSPESRAGWIESSNGELVRQAARHAALSSSPSSSPENALSGVSLIAAERAKQDSSGDDALTEGELLASALLMIDGARGGVDFTGKPLACAWKLQQRHWGDHVRSLAIAGAFIAAEIDRLTSAHAGG